MSEKCIPVCPRIQAAIDNFPEAAHPENATTELLEACRATYDCNGPALGEVEVVVGFIRKRVEARPGLVCGLPE